jgi:hypothetical protein
MPIAQFLDSSEFDPETKRVMAVALEMARAALQLGDQSILWESKFWSPKATSAYRCWRHRSLAHDRELAVGQAQNAIGFSKVHRGQIPVQA